VNILQGSQAALNTLVTEDGQLLLAGNGSTLSTIRILLAIITLLNQATGYASQHIWCLSQARINWEGCARKGIRRENGGDSRGAGTN